MAETMTSKPSAPVTIENIEQASSNFYWTYDTKAGVFNIQTTVRGILTLDQIKAHIKSELEAIAHVVSLGGQAKQVGRNAYEPTTPLPEPTPVEAIIAETMTGGNILPIKEEPVRVDVEEKPNVDIFDTKKLVVSINAGKMYFKVKGGRWMPYGVTVWDEVLVSAGIPVHKLEGKEYDLEGYKATAVLKPDGKPQKVIKLEKVSQN